MIQPSKSFTRPKMERVFRTMGHEWSQIICFSGILTRSIGSWGCIRAYQSKDQVGPCWRLGIHPWNFLFQSLLSDFCDNRLLSRRSRNWDPFHPGVPGSQGSSSVDHSKRRCSHSSPRFSSFTHREKVGSMSFQGTKICRRCFYLVRCRTASRQRHSPGTRCPLLCCSSSPPWLSLEVCTISRWCGWRGILSVFDALVYPQLIVRKAFNALI